MKLLLLLLFLTGVASAELPPLAHGKSPNGQFRSLVTTWFRPALYHSLWCGDRCLWQHPLDVTDLPELGPVLLPDRIFVSDDRRRLAYLWPEGLQLVDGRDGHQERFVHWDDPVLEAEGILGGWFQGDILYLETGLGNLVSLSPGGNWRRVPPGELGSLLDAGLAPASSLRLAALHGLTLHGAWVDSCLASELDEVSMNAAAYGCSRGESNLLQDRRVGYPYAGEWQLLASWPNLDLSKLPVRQYVPRGLGPRLEALCLDKLASGSEDGASQAVSILGALGSRLAVPHLWRRLDAARDPRPEIRALTLILGNEAASGFCQRLDRYPVELCGYFATVRWPPAVPKLVEALELDATRHNLVDVERALVFQTGLTFGLDSKAWRMWLASRAEADQEALLADLGEPSGLLGLARRHDRSLPARLAKIPRLVSLLPIQGLGSFQEPCLELLPGRELVCLRGIPREKGFSWDFVTGNPMRMLPGNLFSEGSWASRDGRTVALESGDQVLVRLPSGKLLEVDGQMDDLSADGRWVLTTVSSNGYYCDTTLHCFLTSLETAERFEVSLDTWQFSPDGRYLLGEKSWSLEGIKPVPLPGSFWFLNNDYRESFVPDPERADILKHLDGTLNTTKSFILASQGGGLSIYDETGRLLARLPDRSPVACSPDESLLAVRSERAVEVVDTSSWRVLTTVPAEGTCGVFSADNRYLALQGKQVASVWELFPKSEPAADELTTELWIGRRWKDGLAVPLTPEEFWQRRSTLRGL